VPTAYPRDPGELEQRLKAISLWLGRMTRSVIEICNEVAGQVLEQQRGLNTPERRIELASQLAAAIRSYLEFEKEKARQTRKPPRP